MIYDFRLPRSARNDMFMIQEAGGQGPGKGEVCSAACGLPSTVWGRLFLRVVRLLAAW